MKRFSSVVLVAILLAAALVRFYDITNLPNGLYWDEMDVGYQAYSFLQTGRDYFGNSLPIHFQSFGDWRVPLYIYTSVPIVWLLGLSPLAVRLPAFLAGVVGVALIYLVGKELTGKERIGLLAALVLAFSPWHIQYSRMAFEATLVLALFLLGIFGFFTGLRKPSWFVISALGFGLAPWAYNTAKLFVPITLLVLVFLYRSELKKAGQRLYLPSFILLILAAPLLYGTLFGRGGMRFSELLIFNDPHVEYQINQKRLEAAVADGEEIEVGLAPRPLDILAHNKPVYWAGALTENYLQSFSTDFLFLQGDSNLRHSPSRVGQMYKVEALALFLGIIALVLKRKSFRKRGAFLLSWLLLAPIPTSLTAGGGMHATRLFLMLPALVIIAASGISFLYETLKGQKKRLVLGGYFALWFIGAALYLQNYFVHYRLESARVFNHDFAKVAQIAKSQEENYDLVIVDAHKESALMAYLFTNKTSPGFFQSLYPLPFEELDKVGRGYRINKTLFLSPGERPWTSLIMGDKLSGNLLLIVSSKQFNQDPREAALEPPYRLFDVLEYPSGEPQFFVIERKPPEEPI